MFGGSVSDSEPDVGQNWDVKDFVLAAVAQDMHCSMPVQLYRMTRRSCWQQWHRTVMHCSTLLMS